MSDGIDAEDPTGLVGKVHRYIDEGVARLAAAGAWGDVKASVVVQGGIVRGIKLATEETARAEAPA